MIIAPLPQPPRKPDISTARPAGPPRAASANHRAPPPQNRRASLLAISQLLRTILVDTLTVYISVVIIITRYKHSNRPRKVAHGQGYGSQNAA
jgi:hypothetical protein